MDEEGLGQRVGGNNDWIVTLMSSPLSGGESYYSGMTSSSTRNFVAVFFSWHLCYSTS